MQAQAAIQTDSLTIVRNGHTILDGLSLAVQPGTITGLIGPSGSGKTTLMRVIVGAQKITSGSATVLGQPAGSKSLRDKIGYVTQSPAVYDDITVVQNLNYFAVLVQTSPQDVDTVLKQVDLEPQRNQIVATLSGGQRARVSLAVALLGNAQLLVLDEPTVGLDPVLRQKLWRLFSSLANQGKTLLISSHVMDEAEQCPDILLLRDGKLLSHGSKEQLLANTNTQSVQAAFLHLAGGEDDAH